MSAETGLQTLLTGDSGIQAVLGTSIDPVDRFAADRIEQGTLRPFGVYTRTQTDRFEGLDGTVHATKVTLELQLWGDTRADAEDLADACQTALNLNGNAITGRSTAYDSELDLEASLLTLEWWE